MHRIVLEHHLHIPAVRVGVRWTVENTQVPHIVHDGFYGLQANLSNPFIDGRAIYIIICEESESGVGGGGWGGGGGAVQVWTESVS